MNITKEILEKLWSDFLAQRDEIGDRSGALEYCQALCDVAKQVGIAL